VNSRIIPNVLATTILFCSSIATAHAATEYLRFEGSMISYYDEFHDGYVAELGFSANQDLYFDFAIDTTREAPGHPDDPPWSDNFWVEYLDGSSSVTGLSHGNTFQFPEGILSLLFITNGVNAFIGEAWQGHNGWDFSIDQWEEGRWVNLMGNCVESFCGIGSLELTYRGSTLPPAIVPIPGAVWLFGSALGLLGWIHRKKAS
jgi:hypothetical protein